MPGSKDAFDLLRDTLSVARGPHEPDDVVKILGHALRANDVVMAELPAGYRVVREERNMDGFMAPEVTFAVFDGDGDEVTTPRAVEKRNAGEWVIYPGSQRSHVDPVEARARAYALLLAAAEVEKRNGEATG